MLLGFSSVASYMEMAVSLFRLKHLNKYLINCHEIWWWCPLFSEEESKPQTTSLMVVLKEESGSSWVKSQTDSACWEFPPVPSVQQPLTRCLWARLLKPDFLSHGLCCVTDSIIFFQSTFSPDGKDSLLRSRSAQKKAFPRLNIG